ncbi:cysteine--1-D-myo-inosityl 2-amino-2-deoxy-alpha-D-glucopyranoside ligase [Phycicoccus sp. Soil803]|uniref:cysteine--1-D-myo-inosityl 2-amino-2-deoxy-alpha-D-glucopyranoside ligase n=1 Tax=Phycicoccus sp. Soil803 TaxID=1736415 RepID=UPI00070E759E|nr:cysteine--1-D-myo-inosityl 2-amino-2-deoxy-alpha-D-glucopyranoside ligase [Phycicoccus sp. Soil803]KRF24939.1 cysteine--1-D-myo-inosityl 2-amino-2-deoxy-alpha-D-glucopyranoside ligase [Phycicoccus sp. Soil803]
MISWPTPFRPAVPGTGHPVQVFDSATGAVRAITPGPTARMYVCGITPYDATHLGHAATYVTFDVLGRALRDAGHDVKYVQNITDVDDPLLERATRDGIDWEDLAAEEIALFREDMTALAVIPPDHYVGVVESIEPVGAAVRALLERGAAYAVDTPDSEGDDLYLDISTDAGFGAVSNWTREQMLAVFADRGGDPDRAGKRDRLDPLLWRAARDGEPSWAVDGLPQGRPGWHIECTAIALDHLGMSFDVQGGGTDLVFPHHEMSATQAVVLTGQRPFARTYTHQAMVGLHGEKMSKSKGNLVLVSKLRADGVDPMAIRLALLGQHYRTEWSWTDAVLEQAQARLDTWRAALSVNSAPDSVQAVEAIRARVADDLDTPGALAAVDAWAKLTLTRGGADITSAGVLARALDAILGVRV